MKDITQNIEEYKEKSEILKALAHPVRLCVIRGLMSDEGCNVTEMQECLEIPQSTLSQHLAKLRNLSIVEGKRNGVEINYYVINEEVRKIVLALFDEHIKEENHE